VPMDNLDYHKSQPFIIRYGISKAGNYLHAVEYAKRYKADGIVSVALNPGNLSSDLYREQGAIIGFLLRHTILHPPVFGAYTEMYAGLSPEVTLERSGEWSKSRFLSY
jgi:retinol dehydrogenase-12